MHAHGSAASAAATAGMAGASHGEMTSRGRGTPPSYPSSGEGGSCEETGGGSMYMHAGLLGHTPVFSSSQPVLQEAEAVLAAGPVLAAEAAVGAAELLGDTFSGEMGGGEGLGELEGDAVLVEGWVGQDLGELLLTQPQQQQQHELQAQGHAVEGAQGLGDMGVEGQQGAQGQVSMGLEWQQGQLQAEGQDELQSQGEEEAGMGLLSQHAQQQGHGAAEEHGHGAHGAHGGEGMEGACEGTRAGEWLVGFVWVHSGQGN